MSFSARIIADSLSPQDVRLTTIEATYPRIVHAEMMTHRVFSRNSASTRAIALSAQLRNLLQNPFIPEKFGINQTGMQSFNFLEGLPHEEATSIWLAGRDRAVTTFIELILGRGLAGEVLGYESKADREYVSGDILLAKLDDVLELIPKTTGEPDLFETSMLNVHKQLAGRGLETYMWHTIVLSATEFDNFYALRDHPDAQGEIATIARLMKQAMDSSTPTQLTYDDWHLPYVEANEFGIIEHALMSSVARTAASSYNRQHVKNPEAEFGRHDKLLAGGHMSPFEHQAKPFSQAEDKLRRTLRSDVKDILNLHSLEINPLVIEQIERQTTFSGNFRGWNSYRKQIAHEDNFARLRTA